MRAEKEPVYETVNLCEDSEAYKQDCLVKELYGSVRKLEEENRRLKQEIERLQRNENTRKLAQIFEERYLAVFENSLDGIILVRLDGTILSANPAACRMFGRSEEELCRLGRDSLVDPNDPILRKALNDRDQSGVFYGEIMLLRKDGTQFPGEVTSKLFADSKGHILSSVVIRDISHRKKIEAALHRSEQKYYRAFHYNQAYMMITRWQDHKIVDANRKLMDLTGYSREEIIGKRDTALWVEVNDRKTLLRQLSKNGYVEKFETKYRKKNGEIGYTLMSATVLEVDDEEYYVISAIDITDRKKAEEALRISYEQFTKVYNANPLLMTIVSIQSGIIMEVNESFLKAAGCTREELIGSHIAKAGIWPDLSEREKYIKKINAEGIARNFETTIRIPAGEICPSLISGVAINWRGEDCILTIVNDISELRRYQAEIVRLDRLNLIGEMSASIAHEIRNPMTTVLGFLQLFKAQDKYREDVEYIDLMTEEIERANAIITEFLSLGKNKPVTLYPENMNDRIRALQPLLLAKSIKCDVDIKLDLGNIPEIMMNNDEFRQLLLNLVLNGIEAMPGGGCLIIRTCRKADEVVLAIEDQGCGIKPEVLDKLGTPFFTTKEHGNGLGLAVCYSIAHKHHARIEVGSGPDGTSFKIIFPAIKGED